IQSGYIGIQTADPAKPLHIDGGNDYIECTDPAIRLSYRGQPEVYAGHLVLRSPFNNSYSMIPQQDNDVILQSDAEAGNLILTTRNLGASIKFATTPLIPPIELDIERMRINSEGFVGIGDTIPKEILQLSNHIAFHKKFELSETDYIGFNRYNLNITGKRFQPGAAASLEFKNYPPSNEYYIDLALSGYNAGINDVVNYNETTGSGRSGMRIALGDDNRARFGFGVVNDDVSRIKVKGLTNDASTNSLMVTNNAGMKTFVVRDDRQVYIGTGYYTGDLPTNCYNRLSVDGQIVALDIIVTLSPWSDFVFDKNYNLMELPELEKLIRQNGHLPGIPSAKEVKEKGVNVGEMQAKLLQKIEELTLYVIDLKKQNDILNAKIEQLKTNK
ncbi:MAG: hypothetical protein HW421_4107, partial [Ignavibacteria bacterium]|nr:hypothetical protein [Ignavibacteria bacterium]